MKQAHIYITPSESNPLGVIGEVVGENGETIKGTQLIDVMTQVSKYPGVTSFLFHCAGPGGAVDVGDQIHDYMEGLKAEGKIVDTITDGDVGSILTKIYMAGQTRTMVDGHKFYIHAPWVSHIQGNATQIIQGLEDLIKEENKLLSFYKQKTGITDAGLKGLMEGSGEKDGTFITADQAVSLKFATVKAPSKIKAFALLKNPNMAKDKLTVGQKIGQLIDMVTGKSQINALDLQTKDGKTISVSAEDPANLVGADVIVTDEAGNTVEHFEGETELADGRILVVSGGKVADVKPAAAAQAAVPAAPATPTVPANPAATPAAPKPSAMEIELQNKVKALETELAAMKAVNIDDKINAAIDGLKNSLVSGKAPVKAISNNGQGAVPPGPKLSPVQQKMMAYQQKQNKN